MNINRIKYKLLMLTILMMAIPRVMASEGNIISLANPAGGDCTLLESNGKYLIMDTGDNDIEDGNRKNNLIDYLESNGIKDISIYISHYHSDHFSQVLKLLDNDNVTISKIYLPNPDYIKKYDNDEFKENNADYYKNITYYLDFYNSVNEKVEEKKIEYEELWTGSEFDFGDFHISIIGPVGEYTVEQFEGVRGGTTLNHYVNNNSLVAKITIGEINYFSAGDMEKEEEKALIDNNIDVTADIMKLSHHGGYTSNITDDIDFVSKVNPKYAFYNRGSNDSQEIDTFNSYGWTKDTVSKIVEKTNVYSEYNGTVTFNIKDNVINVFPEKNYRKITFNYLNNDDELMQKRDYMFNNAAPYHLYNYIPEIDGYSYDDARNTEEVFTMGTLTSDKEYNIYFTNGDINNNPKTGGAFLVIAGVFLVLSLGAVIFIRKREIGN